MNIRVERIEKDLWDRELASDAHRAVFGEISPPGFDRIDYALLAVDIDQTLAIAYVTIRELNAKTAYLKHGGSFDPIINSIFSLPAYLKFMEYLKARYDRLETLVENTNIVYLKFAFKAGLKVTGIRTFGETVLCELSWEKN